MKQYHPGSSVMPVTQQACKYAEKDLSAQMHSPHMHFKSGVALLS